MEPAQPPIRIEQAELDASSVDDVLARQASFGMATAVPRAPDRKTSLLYRPWFALMIAGALGGFAGWAAIEPFLDDGLAFSGKVAEVSESPVEPGLLQLDVAGLPVLARDGITRVHRAGAAVPLQELAGAVHARVRGSSFVDGGKEGIFAAEVELLPGAPPEGALTLQALRLRAMLVGLAVFPVIAALVGLFVAAADGLLSRAWRRAALSGLVGLASGLALGLVTSFVGEVVYQAGQGLVESLRDGKDSLPALLAQMATRSLAWAVTGTAMGLGQGIALRSRKLLVNGLLGGTVGALVGGLLFDPIERLIPAGFGSGGSGGAELSRAAGFVVIGLTTGLMIGVVELLAREAWLKMLTGPLAGKEFVLFKNPTVVGSSPKADVYLFKDPDVEPVHAKVHQVGESYELEDAAGTGRLFLNGRPVRRARLEAGDQIRLGKTILSFGLKEA